MELLSAIQQKQSWFWELLGGSCAEEHGRFIRDRDREDDSTEAKCLQCVGNAIKTCTGADSRC